MAGDPTPVPQSVSADPVRLRHLLLCLRKALGHDLSNQLIGVQGLLRLLESEEGHLLQAAGKEYLHLLQNGVKRAQERIRLLANLARSGSGTPVLFPVPLDEVAREAIASVQMLYPERGTRFEEGESLPLLPVTRTDLRDVLIQLIRNAVEATDPNQQPIVELAGGSTTEHFWFRITDQGRGLHPNDLRRLHAFFSNQEDQGFRGGLGLLLVRGTVAAWHGRLEATSQPGRGCAVTCFIPRFQDPVPT